MHSLNHPKVDVFAPFARALADKIAVKTTDANGPTYAPDALSGNYWPLYPEVAEIYGLPGSYEWNIDGRVAGLREFVE